MSNTTYNLGRVGLNLRGEYSSTAAYEPLDVATWTRYLRVERKHYGHSPFG